MHTVVIATGNSDRGDEAAPRRVLELIGNQPGVELRDVSSLNEGLARDIGSAREVVFINSTPELGEPWVESAPPRRGAGFQAHDARDLVAVATAVHHFHGRAYACHVPGLDFSPGSPLTPYAEFRARQAVCLLRRILGSYANSTD